MKPKRLILFDIDGTILTTRRAAWEPPFRESIEEAWKEEVEFLNQSVQEAALVGTNAQRYRPGGKTDTQIVFELLEGTSLTEPEIFRLLPAIREKYLVRLRKVLSDPAVVEVKPGVEELLKDLAQRSEAVLSLLTGNFEEGARAKLGARGLEKYFQFGSGAFGDFAKQRRELPDRAVGAAKKSLGLDFSGKDIVIIGDTPNDIHCGRHLSVRVIAVATGPFTVEQLSAEGPDYVFPDLTDRAAVMDAIFSEIS